MADPFTSQPVSQMSPNTEQVPLVEINCPPGLKYLTKIEKLLVYQKVELLEAFCGCETKNKYAIKNSSGQQLYFAAEDTDCCTRTFCGSMRPFHMKILDNICREAIHIYRPCRCTGCCYPCCLQELEISSPPGTVIGYVKQRWSLFIPSFDIQNAAGDTVLQLKGPCFTSSCCKDVNFTVYSRDVRQKLGILAKNGLTT